MASTGLLAQWEAQVAAATTSADLRACLDVDRAAALKAAGLDRARVVELLSVKREADVDRWADGVAPAFGAFLNKLRNLPDPAPVSDAAGGSDGKGGAADVSGGDGGTQAGDDGQNGKATSTAAAAAAPGNALAPAANDGGGGGGNGNGNDVNADVPLVALRGLYHNMRQRQMAITAVVCTVYGFVGLIQAGVAMFGDNMYGYSYSACECVMVNAYMGVFEGATDAEPAALSLQR